MKERTKTQSDDKLIFIVLGIILVVAIGVILTWYFTKEEVLDDKDPAPIKEVEDDPKEETEDPVVTKPTSPAPNITIVDNTTKEEPPIKEVENNNEEEEEPAAPVMSWDKPDVPISVYVRETISIPSTVTANGKVYLASVTVEKWVTDNWVNIASNVTQFKPVEAGTYRLVYTVDKVSKEYIFDVKSGIVSLSNLTDEMLDAYEAELLLVDPILPDSFVALRNNISKTNITSENSVYNLLINAEYDDDNGDIPYTAMIKAKVESYDGSNLSFTVKDSLDNDVTAITVSDLSTESWGEEDTFGVEFNFNGLAFDEEYTITLTFATETFDIVVKFVKNYVVLGDIDIVNSTTSVDLGLTDADFEGNTEKFDAVINNGDEVGTTVVDNEIELDYDDTNLEMEDGNPNDDSLPAPIGIIVKLDDNEDAITSLDIIGDAVLPGYPEIDNSLVERQLLIWLDANKINGSTSVTLTINGIEVVLDITLAPTP